MPDNQSHAAENARGHLESIRAAYDAAQFAAGELEGRELGRDAKALLREHGYDGTNHDAVAEAIIDSLREAPLSLTVRSGWYQPGDHDAAAPEEYCILLTTGGPALRLIGNLSAHGEPESATLEHQNWFTPWTPYDTTAADDEALEWFASLFFYAY